MTKRVVVTGMGGLSPLGLDWEQIEANLRARRSAVRCADCLHGGGRPRRDARASTRGGTRSTQGFAAETG